MAIDDPQRLAALVDSGVLAGEALPGIDRLLRVAKRALGTPMVMFTAVEPDRQVFVSQLGLPAGWTAAGETPLTHSYCQFVVADDRPLVSEDSTADPRLADNRATTEDGIRAYLGVPVRSHGHTLGALCALDTSARSWSDDDLSTLEDIASAVEGELSLREATRQLSEQLESESLELGFEESMSALAAETNRSWTVGAVARAIAENGRDATGAALVQVALHDLDELRLFDTDRYIADGSDRWVDLDLEGPLPMARAARSQQPVVLSDPAMLADCPEFMTIVAPLGIQSFVALPLGSTDAGGDAVIGVGWHDRLSGSEVPRSVRRLGALARQGLDRAHSHQMAREHAALLESLVLPDRLPVTPELDLSGIYLPPSSGQRVGGDLYDAVLRDDGKVALIVADVTGHELVSSLVTSRVRNAFTMLSLEGRGPAESMRQINRYLLRSTMSTHITAAVALIDTEAQTVTIANSGHPQPRLRRADGSVEPVGPAGEPLMGLHPVDYREDTVEFAHGDGILLFTDGLIERRDRPFPECEEILDRELTVWSGGAASALVDHLTDALSSRDDDVALIYARSRESIATRRLERSWRADELVLRDARAELEGWAGAHQHLDDILLVATELLTNARSAVDSDHDDVGFVATDVDGVVSIEVSNPGSPFDVGSTGMPDPAQARGRGLAIAAAVARLSVENDAGRVTVHAVIGP